MPFITQGKTNWKFLLIIIVLAIIVGGGFLGCLYLYQIEKPTPEILPVDEISCNKDEDCVITSYTYDCCGAPCGGEIVNKQEFEKRKQWTMDNCRSEDFDKCPLVNCFDIDQKAVCENNKCIRKSF